MMKKFALLLMAGILHAQDTVLENGTIQFKDNPQEEKTVRKIDDHRAGEVVVSGVRFLEPNHFQFEINIPCRAMIMVKNDRGTALLTLFSGQLDAGIHRITSRNLAELKPGKYHAEFLIAPQLLQEREFGQSGCIQFKAPVNVRLSPRGEIFVDDSNRIIKWDSATSKTTVFKENAALLDIDAAGNIYACSSPNVIVLSSDGKMLNSFRLNPSVGFACGAPGVYFARTGAGHALWYGTGNPVIFKKSTANGRLGPVYSKYAAPSIAADRKDALYAADSYSAGIGRGAVAKYIYDGTDIKPAYHCVTPFRDMMGIAVAGNLIYGVERGTVAAKDLRRWKPDFISRLVQLFDSGHGLNVANRWELPGVTGVRAVAATPDGRRFYILEDAEDFHSGNESSLPGKGRLFQFSLKAAKESSQTFTVSKE